MFERRIARRLDDGIAAPVAQHLHGNAIGLGKFFKPNDSGRWWIAGNQLCQKWQTWYDGRTQCFTLQKAGDNSWWIVEPATNRADPLLVGALLTNLLSLRIVDYAKEIPTEADLASFGLIDPRASYSLFERYTNNAGITTNILFQDISFGTNRELLVYARRFFERTSFTPRVPRLLPVASAFAVSLAGLAIVYESLSQAGVM